VSQQLIWRNTEKRWGWISIIIHWLSALTVISLFTLGLWMVDLTYYDDWYRTAPEIHKSTGICLLLLTVVYLVWRTRNGKPASLSTHSAIEIKAARLAHVLIYVLLLLIILSGYLISTADGREIVVFSVFEIPATIYGIDQQEDIAGVVHLVLAISLMAVVALHAAGALKHHFIDKDLTLKRMLGIHKLD